MDTNYPEQTQFPPSEHPDLWEECPKCLRFKKAPADFTGDMCLCEENKQELLTLIRSLRAGLPVSGEKRRLELLERELKEERISLEQAEQEFREIEQAVNP